MFSDDEVADLWPETDPERHPARQPIDWSDLTDTEIGHLKLLAEAIPDTGELAGNGGFRQVRQSTADYIDHDEIRWHTDFDEAEPNSDAEDA